MYEAIYNDELVIKNAVSDDFKFTYFESDDTLAITRNDSESLIGITINDCETVSKATDPVLEKELGLDYDYFEVSSPGLTRPLEEVSDYLRYMGETLDVSLYAPVDGVKEFSCVCEDASEDKVKLKASNGTEYELALSDIAKAVRHIEF